MRKLTFASLQVRDLAVSRAFYTDQLGFETDQSSNLAACIFKYKDGEASFAIRTPIADLEGKTLGTGVSLWFAIDEQIEDFQNRLTQKGILFLGGINVTPFGKTLMVQDPDGYIITFLETA